MNRSETRMVAEELKLTPSDELEYRKIIRPRPNMETNTEYNVYYRKVLASNKCSYAVKQKAVLWLTDFEPSRSWGFRNLAGKFLLVFVEDIFAHHNRKVTSEDIRDLIANPAFAASAEGYFNLPVTSFNIPFIHSKEENILRQKVVDHLAASPNMNLEVAEFIIKADDLHMQLGLLDGHWKMDVSSVLEWVRNTYDIGDVPDSWVRQFLVGSGSR